MDYKLLKDISHERHPLLSDSPTLDRSHVKLLTYNLFMRPPPVKTNASDFKDA